jgi:hypothetical protein
LINKRKIDGGVEKEKEGDIDDRETDVVSDEDREALLGSTTIGALSLVTSLF